MSQCIIAKPQTNRRLWQDQFHTSTNDERLTGRSRHKRSPPHTNANKQHVNESTEAKKALRLIADIEVARL